MEIKERFLNYVSFDTQSAENSQTVHFLAQLRTKAFGIL